MAQPPLIHLQDIHLTFGGKPLFEGAELQLGPRERLCLVGRNGSGKSTLLKIVAGLEQPDNGTVFVQPTVTVRYLPQEPDLTGFATTAAFVEAGLAPGDDPHRARTLLEDLGMTGDEDPATLSGGEARRAALARVLAPEPDVLLLDEPTNHLDVGAIEALEALLKRQRSAIVLISHDRRFLENLSNATVWLDRGTTRRLDKGFGAFEAWRDQVLDEEERDSHKLDRKILREEHWVRYGVTARRKRNQGRMRALAALRSEQRERRANRPAGGIVLKAQDAGQSGKLVIEAENVAKSYDGRPIVSDVSMRVPRGVRIGLLQRKRLEPALGRGIDRQLELHQDLADHVVLVRGRPDRERAGRLILDHSDVAQLRLGGLHERQEPARLILLDRVDDQVRLPRTGHRILDLVQVVPNHAMIAR